MEAELELERSQKARGSHKFMGGGQFKSAGNNKVTRQCPVCFTLRETIQKMKAEGDEALQNNQYLRGEIERFKFEADQNAVQMHSLSRLTQEAEHRAQLLETERDNHIKIAELKAAEAHAARSDLVQKTSVFDSMREQMEQNSNALREQIRKLQDLLAAREREVEQFKQSAQQFEQRTAAAQARLEQVLLELKELQKIRDVQNERLNHQEQTIEELRARLAEANQQPVLEDRSEYIQRLENRIAELERRLREALEDAEKARQLASELQACQRSLAEKEEMVSQLQSELSGAQSRVADLIAANADLSAINKEMIVTVERLEGEKETVTVERDDLARQLAELRNNDDSGDLRRIIEERDVTIAELRPECEHLRKENEENKATLRDSKVTVENLREDVAEAKQTQKVLEKEIVELKRKLKIVEEEIQKNQELALKEKTKLENELQKANAELATKSGIVEEQKIEIAQLKKDLAKKDRTILDLMDKHVKDLEKAKQDALEKTMQSMVRLCVVAPTVNVSFGSEALTCKAGLPGEKIHDIIENQILPGFIQLFLQPTEGLGPDGAQLGKWVEKLMGDMQASIEKHLAGVFRQKAR